MTAPARRGLCPGLFTPMPTGDGLLARLPQREPYAPDVLVALCRAAGEFGSGIVEVTSRGSIQVRGLTERSAAGFAERAVALGIEELPGPPVIASPLAGLDPSEVADLRVLATDLRHRLVLFAGHLAPKVSVVVEGGGCLPLSGVTADLRLQAATGNRLHLAVGGDASTAAWLGVVDRADAVTAAAAILGVIARRGRIARAREILQAEGAGAFAAPLEKWLSAATAPRPGPPAAPIGSHALGDGAIAIGLGLPFGQADASVLAQLAAAAREAGASGLAPTMGRTLLAIGLSRDSAGAFTDEAERLGFIVRADDPRQAIIACAGAPACASARIPTRRIAAAIARAAAPMLDGTRRIHLSGCAKGCASADPAALTIVGGAAGCGIVTEGTTADDPEEVVALGALAGRIAELAMRSAAHRLTGEYRAPTRGNASPPEPVHE